MTAAVEDQVRGYTFAFLFVVSWEFPHWKKKKEPATRLGLFKASTLSSVKAHGKSQEKYLRIHVWCTLTSYWAMITELTASQLQPSRLFCLYFVYNSNSPVRWFTILSKYHCCSCPVCKWIITAWNKCAKQESNWEHILNLACIEMFSVLHMSLALQTHYVWSCKGDIWRYSKLFVSTSNNNL